MIEGATRLTRRLLGAQLLSTLGSVLAASAARWLLLLDRNAATASIALLWEGIVLGGALAMLVSAVALHRQRYLLRALALGSSAVELRQLAALAAQPSRVTFGWLSATSLGISARVVLGRPSFLDAPTTLGVSLLGLVVVAAVALPLYVMSRRAVMRALVLADPSIARELLHYGQDERKILNRTHRRLLAAFVMPVAFVTIGSTLVVMAHLRRADGQRRDATALGVARAAFEQVPGPLPHAGLGRAIAAARAHGFSARYLSEPQQYGRTRVAGGNIELVAPMDEGSVEITYAATGRWTIGPLAWFVAAIATALAAWIGHLIGKTLVLDLVTAARGVRALDTEPVPEGQARLVGPTRFQVVTDLAAAIEKLSIRFRVFAQAQERAIRLREAATRMRGLFFASVSHDLKSPLNAILGFSEVIRQSESLTEGQQESLTLIERRGCELLALIETILDAARVEAHQLQIVREVVTVGDLMRDSIERGRHLAGDNPVDVVGDIADGIGALEVDRTRLAGAIATFIGHAARTVPGALVRLRVAPLPDDMIGFAIEMPQPAESADRLTTRHRDQRPMMSDIHRGLALGMGLARSIVELHSGSMRMQNRGPKGLRFVLTLPARQPASAAVAPRLHLTPVPAKE